MGGVTVAATVKAKDIASPEHTAAHTLRLAAAMTQDLRRRIERGEAHRHALALTKGEFDQGAPEATIELSNHGQYPTLCEGQSVLLGQRFDDYEGTSISAHSEAHSGHLHLCASVGKGLNASLVEAIMHRASGLLGGAGST